MSRRMALAALLAAASLSQSANAQTTVDLGKWEYESNCAVCHGTDGRGNGPYKSMLRIAPSDLTVLSKMNGGTFPFEEVYKILDGTKEVIAHGPREMPIWGYEYMEEVTRKHLKDIPPYEVAADTRIRIPMLIDYLQSLQVK